MNEFNKSLILVTSQYPFNKGEEFVESELLFLSRYFKQIFIIPFWSKGGEKRSIPANCKIIDINVSVKIEKKFRFLTWKHLSILIWSFSILLKKSKSRLYYIKNFRKVLTDLVIILEESQILCDQLKPWLNSTNKIYFYWFDKPFIHFAFLKKQGKINHNLISRGLGYDYDPIQNSLGFFPYREIELEYLDKLVLNSNYGMHLVQKLYPKHAKKFESCYLGLTSRNKLNPSNKYGVFHLVSCSYVIDIKRVHLIIDILRNIHLPVKWTHIGQGPLLNEIKGLAHTLPTNIETEFPGYIPSVMDYYETVPCDLFITTTLMEGLPFTLMEAISFGIPVMGTQVCGIPEIVTADTGFLIPVEFNPASVAAIITKYATSPYEERELLRRGAKEFFNEAFTTEKNSRHFINTYLKN